MVGCQQLTTDYKHKERERVNTPNCNSLFHKALREWLDRIVSLPQQCEHPYVECIEALTPDQFDGPTLVDTPTNQVRTIKQLESFLKIFHFDPLSNRGFTIVHAAR